MTKKQYIAIANIFREVRPVKVTETSAEYTQYILALNEWRRIVSVAAMRFSQTNPAFLSGRWIDYIEGKCTENGRVIA